MFKKLATLLAGAALTIGVVSGTAMAYNLPTYSDFSWVNAPLWTNTDKTTANSQFTLAVENFATNRDSSFGLFYIDANQPNIPITYDIFSATDEPGDNLNPTQKTVTFRVTAGNTYQITLDNNPNDSSDWTDFGKVFGFYFDFVNSDDTSKNQTYYSLYNFDTIQDNKLNVLTAADTHSQVLIYLDRDGKLETQYQMVIQGNDLTPVPEPGTMVLLGAGMLGLAIFGKRRMNREA